MPGEYTKYEIVITAIVVKEGKYLITRRAMTKKRWPGRWTVPGGHLDPSDYESFPKDAADYWYNVLERALKREVLEETGLAIKNVEYVTSLATTHADGSTPSTSSGQVSSPQAGTPSIVISCMADYDSGEVRYIDGETDSHAWVSLAEAKNYDLIDGIYDELVMTDKKRKGDKTEWQRAE